MTLLSLLWSNLALRIQEWRTADHSLTVCEAKKRLVPPKPKVVRFRKAA